MPKEVTLTQPPCPATQLVEATAEAAVFRFAARILDEQAVRCVRRHLGWLVEESDRRGLHLDLVGVEAATAGGLGRLVALHRELRSAGGELVLRNVEGEAYEVFRLTGLIHVLDVRPKDGCAA